MAAAAPPPRWPRPRAGPAPSRSGSVPATVGRACALEAMAAAGLRRVLWQRAAARLWAARAVAAPPGARAGERGGRSGGESAGGCPGGGGLVAPGPGCEGGVTSPARLRLPAGPAPTRPCCSPASLGNVQGLAARAVPADAGGAGSCRQEVQHAGGGLRALPRRRLRVSWGSRGAAAGRRPRPAPPALWGGPHAGSLWRAPGDAMQ